MDIAAALNFTFQDKEWFKKLLIPALLTLTGLGFVLVLGWFLEIIRRVARQDPAHVPGWSDPGRYLGSGIQVCIVLFLLLAPAALLIAVPGSAAFLVEQTVNDPQILESFQLLFWALTFLGAAMYLSLIGLIMPPVFGLLAVTGRLDQALNPANVIRLIRSNPRYAVTAWLVPIAVHLVVYLLSSSVFCVGVFFGLVYTLTATGHLYGQFYLNATISQLGNDIMVFPSYD